MITLILTWSTVGRWYVIKLIIALTLLLDCWVVFDFPVSPHCDGGHYQAVACPVQMWNNYLQDWVNTVEIHGLCLDDPLPPLTLDPIYLPLVIVQNTTIGEPIRIP